jgi:hypothetical protein
LPANSVCTVTPTSLLFTLIASSSSRQPIPPRRLGSRNAPRLAAALDQLRRRPRIPQAPAKSTIACDAYVVRLAGWQFSGPQRMQ